MTNETIFDKIIKGDVPSYKVYEDEKFLAFFDICPISKGHTLIIPKTRYERVTDMPEEEYLEYQRVVLKLLKHYKDVLGYEMAMLIYGLDVPHVHIHIFPRTDEVEIFDFSKTKRYLKGEAENYVKKLKVEVL